jgi:VanZ family protein
LSLPGTPRNLLLFIFTAAFVALVFGQLPGDTLLWRELQNTGHTLLFGLLTFITLRLVRSTGRDSQTPYRSYLIAGCACLATGIATEFAQQLTGRGFSQTDILRDLAGICVALGLHAVFDRTNVNSRVIRSAMLRGITFALSCGLLAASLYPLGSLALDIHARRLAFPTIIDMRADWAGSILELNETVLDLTPDAGTCGPVMDDSLTGLHLSSARYPGISVSEPYPDWRSYQYLTFALFSDRPEPFDLVLRIHDRLHDHTYPDRFNRKLKVSIGENRYRILLADVENAADGRKLDLANIANVMLFAVDITRPLEFCAGLMRLEE